MGKTNS